MSINQPQGTVGSDDNFDAEIGRRVHQMMWDQQLTQTTFARLSGMDQSGVAKRLRGKLGWSAKQLRDAARVLNTTASYLMGETENPRPGDPNGGNGAPQETRTPDPLGVNEML